MAAGLSEAGGGALLALGLAVPVAGAAAAGAMSAATAVHWEGGLFSQHGGFELPLLLGATAVGVGLTGAGRLSLDHATNHVLDRSWMVVAAFAGTTLLAGTVVNRRNAVMAKRAGAAEEDRVEAEAVRNAEDAAEEARHEADEARHESGDGGSAAG